jgi:uncharacterized protein (DUF2147 family)
MKASVIYFLVIIFSESALKTDIVGTWKLPEDNTEVEIKKDGEDYKGVVVKSDIETVIGEEIIRDLKEKDGIWKGKFYAVRKDRLVDIMIIPNGDELDVEISARRRTKTMKWTRVE